MRLPPSCPERGDVARGAAVRLGATPLEALIVGQVASYGALCWLKDRELADDIVQRNGRHPHPRSVARSRRKSANLGLLQSQRLLPGARVPGMKRLVTYGSTAKIVIFDKRFGVRDPLTRGQKRRLRLRQLAVEAEYGPPIAAQTAVGPKYSAPSPTEFDGRPRTGDPKLDSIIEQTARALSNRAEVRHQQEDQRMMDSVRALRKAERDRGPPD